MKAELKGTGKNQELVITLPVSEHVSASGKSVVIASTNGNIPTVIQYKDKVVYLGVNAYVRNDK